MNKLSLNSLRFRCSQGFNNGLKLRVPDLGFRDWVQDLGFRFGAGVSGLGFSALGLGLDWQALGAELRIETQPHIRKPRFMVQAVGCIFAALVSGGTPKTYEPQWVPISLKTPKPYVTPIYHRSFMEFPLSFPLSQYNPKS